MDSIFNEVCVLVTAAFALTLVPGFRQPERSLLSRRDQGTALLVFLVLGLIEEATVSHAGSLNERIVAVCAAGLVAGPWVGLTVSEPMFIDENITMRLAAPKSDRSESMFRVAPQAILQQCQIQSVQKGRLFYHIGHSRFPRRESQKLEC